jgi:isopropylmalate/homocitrate/citramalate synthase
MGVQADEEAVKEILSRVKSMGQEKKRLITQEEFIRIIQDCGCDIPAEK